MTKGQKDLFSFLIWSYYIIIAVIYSITYLSTSKFSGTFELSLVGWTFDYLDPEWRILCDFIEPLIIYLLCYFFLKHLFRKVKLLFYIFSGLIFGGYLSRLGFIFTLSLMTLNFFFVKYFKADPLFTKIHWIFHLSIIYVIYVVNGLNNIWGQSGIHFNQRAPVPWDHIYIWTLLRMTSYNFEATEINPLEYFAYLLYPPLYYSGPLIEYNDWLFNVWNTETVKKKHKFILLFIVLFALQILAQCYALASHQNNQWIWEKQIATFAGFSFLITSMFQLYLRYVFIWALQECWASYDNVLVKGNNKFHMFCINSPQSFVEGFCNSYKIFILKYVEDLFTTNKYLNLTLIYSITIILTNSSQKTFIFFITLFLLHLVEERIQKIDQQKIIHQIVFIGIRIIEQCIILMEIMILYTTDLEIFWTFFKNKQLCIIIIIQDWIPIFIGTSILTQMLSLRYKR